MKRKIVLFFFIGIMTQVSYAQKDTFNIVASVSMIADMTENIIGAEDEKVQFIVPIGGDPHLYEPTPSDVKLLSEADLILVNGLKFEGWIEKLIKSSDTKAKVVTVTEGIVPIESDTYQNAADPHAWMDVTNAYTYIKNIKDAMIEARPAHADMYAFNHGVYLQTLQDLNSYVAQQIKKIDPAKRILVTSHDAFKYFGRRYGIELESVLGISTEAEAQTADIVRLHKVIKESAIPAIFVESTINPKMLEEIAKSNNISIGGELYADSLGPKDSPASTYVDMIRHNVRTIVAGLTMQTTSSQGTDTHTEDASSNYWMWGLLVALLLGGFGLVFTKLNNNN